MCMVAKSPKAVEETSRLRRSAGGVHPLLRWSLVAVVGEKILVGVGGLLAIEVWALSAP